MKSRRSKPSAGSGAEVSQARTSGGRNAAMSSASPRLIRSASVRSAASTARSTSGRTSPVARSAIVSIVA